MSQNDVIYPCKALRLRCSLLGHYGQMTVFLNSWTQIQLCSKEEPNGFMGKTDNNDN